MVNGANAGGAAGAAAYQAMANAIKASGTIVEVESDDFMAVVERNEAPLVVYAAARFFSKHKYITSYRGLCFFTKTAMPLVLPSYVEVINTRKIWMPS